MLKMYCLTLYNLSPIQQGIQSAHAIVEYLKKHQASVMSVWERCRKRANVDKTIIIFNWGTSVTLEQHLDFVQENYIDVASFQEPDLWWITTAFCFIAEDWDEITRYFTPLFKLA